MNNNNTINRLKNFRQTLTDLQLEAVVILSVENRYYFSQFNGSSGALVITNDEAVLLTDSRYSEEATLLATNFEVICHKGRLIEDLCKYLKYKNIKRLGIEGSIPVNQYKDLEKCLQDVSFVMIDHEIMNLRKIKDYYEVSCIRKGIKICEIAFEHMLTYIQPGMSEKELALELEYIMKKNGADQVISFLVLASGERTAFPHAKPSDRIVQIGDFVKMDYGAIVNGYYSDFTRTVVVGEPTSKQKEIYNIVLKAQEAALKHIKPGMISSEIDNIARSVIKDAGYHEYFGHGLGHSIGLNIHESPGFRTDDNSKIAPGMVITVEPGIYLPGWGGVRIEDVVVINENGYENLTTATKELQVIKTQQDNKNGSWNVLL